MNPDFRDMLSAFNAEGVEFLLVGAYALAVHGIPRASPGCGGRKAWTTGRGLWVCSSCEHQSSVRAGTIFQDTRLPLTVWFRVIWWVTSQKTGASALNLQKVLGLGSYRTA